MRYFVVWVFVTNCWYSLAVNCFIQPLTASNSKTDTSPLFPKLIIMYVPTIAENRTHHQS